MGTSNELEHVFEQDRDSNKNNGWIDLFEWENIRLQRGLSVPQSWLLDTFPNNSVNFNKLTP
jgi:hypothetical protein